VGCVSESASRELYPGVCWGGAVCWRRGPWSPWRAAPQGGQHQYSLHGSLQSSDSRWLTNLKVSCFCCK
jgi:hypothetical protein